MTRFHRARQQVLSPSAQIRHVFRDSPEGQAAPLTNNRLRGGFRHFSSTLLLNLFPLCVEGWVGYARAAWCTVLLQNLLPLRKRTTLLMKPPTKWSPGCRTPDPLPSSRSTRCRAHAPFSSFGGGALGGALCVMPLLQDRARCVGNRASLRPMYLFRLYICRGVLTRLFGEK